MQSHVVSRAVKMINDLCSTKTKKCFKNPDCVQSLRRFFYFILFFDWARLILVKLCQSLLQSTKDTNNNTLVRRTIFLSSLTLNQTCLAASILCSCSHPKPLSPVLSRRCRTERRQSDDAVVSACSFLVITNRSIFCCRLQQHIKIHLSLL